MDRVAARRLIKRLDDWYIYVLWSSTADALFPFYVGMGRGIRALRHSNPHSRRENPIKNAAWNRCIAAGGSILYSFAETGLAHESAKPVEIALIASIGRRISGTGPLSNLTIGGEGVVGVVHHKAGASPRAKRLFVEGRLFPSKHEASAELGLSQATILYRLRAGWPGYHYPGEPPFPCRKGRRKGLDNHNTRAVFADGVRFPTLSAAARRKNVHPPAILRRITSGWPGYYYEDEGQRPSPGLRKQYSVTIHGVEYPSSRDAAISLGVSRPTITQRLRNRVPGYFSSSPHYQPVGNTNDIVRSAPST